MANSVTQRIRVKLKQHGPSGLLMAYSDDMKGLLVPGDTEQQILERIPVAIRELLEAQGHTVVDVSAERDLGSAPSEFVPVELMASVSIERRAS